MEENEYLLNKVQLLQQKVEELKNSIAQKEAYINGKKNIMENPTTPLKQQQQQQQQTPGSSALTLQQAVEKTAAVEKAAKKSTLKIPEDIMINPELDEAIAKTLPGNYNFEIRKTLWRIRRAKSKRIALQLPEGLQQYACPIGDLLQAFSRPQVEIEEVVILADVTYGACCIDDFGAKALGCELLIHYGHSCLIPIDQIKKENDLEVMYVFVEISFDVKHLIESLKLTFPNAESTKLCLMGTIQFSGALHEAKKHLDLHYKNACIIPQAKPLSGGEVLGCTSPTLTLNSVDALVFIADGRFHLESAMIANPWLPAYRYDPYGKVLSREHYEHELMMKNRKMAIDLVGYDNNKAGEKIRLGVILGTLGRQGNVSLLNRVVQSCVERNIDHFVVLMSELNPVKLKSFETSEKKVNAWVQIACPRLSIDWGLAFSKPLLTPYEFFVCVGKTKWKSDTYPQDFYAANSGEWTNYYVEQSPSE